MKTINIVHIDSEKSWRGGQRQVLELIKGLNRYPGCRNVLFCKKGGELYKRAAKMGIEVYEVPMLSELDLYSAMKIRAFIQKEKIDLIHAHSAHAHTIGLLAKKMTGCKLVVSRRVDFQVKGTINLKYKYKPVDRFICVSDAIRKILIENGLEKEKTVTVRSGFAPSAVYSKDIEIRKEFDIAEEDFLVAVVAALAPHKSLDVLLRAAKIINGNNPRIKFIIAGEGPSGKKLLDLAKSLRIVDSVKFAGFLENVGDLYREANLFALSSSEEGLCTSILDAMYHGLPVVSTSAGGIPELVQDGVNGFLVDTGDYENLAEKILTLAENKMLLNSMSDEARKILGNNPIETTVKKTFDVYRKLWE